ncbi:MAG: phage baseplate protein [Flavobacteriaceae bacterium]|nr:phage baseplate protein [Flavobacteriaceae bacterium]|tara:strand:+ start:4124 stop:7393 length:3270 start_codon:yes stop_codon:yes gene_type:complete
MAKDCNHTMSHREGTSQTKRFITALQPDRLQLHDFSVEDWVLFAYHFGKQVHFFETTNDKVPVGTWRELFNLLEISEELPLRGTPEYQNLKSQLKALIEQAKIDHSMPAQLTLFITFLKLLHTSQEHLNQLTKRHLDFYYRRVLQIEKKAPIADQAHVIFELAKKMESHLIQEGTLVQAGKDANNTPRSYAVNRPLVVNQASVAHIKSLYNDTDYQQIKAAAIANSFDGNGGDFPEAAPYWHPFGYSSKASEFPELPAARIGFAMASPMLLLGEGQRTVVLQIHFAKEATLKNQTFQQLKDAISFTYSGTKSWIASGWNLIQKTTIKNEKGVEVAYESGLNKGVLTLVGMLPPDAEAITAYQESVHQEQYDTSDPIVKVVIATNTSEGYQFFRNVVHQPIEDLSIAVAVTGITSVQIESDLGVLPPDKPFYPFTPQPKVKSHFSIQYDEAFAKQWHQVAVKLQWKDTPTSFVDHYFAYRKEQGARSSKTAYYNGIFSEKKRIDAAENQPEEMIMKASASERSFEIVENPNNLLVPTEDHFKATPLIKYREVWQATDTAINLFESSKEGHHMSFQWNNKSYELDKAGPLRLTLQQSFLHTQFPRIYALALASEDPNTLVPNAPYTPFAEGVTLSYTAKEQHKIKEKSVNSYKEARIRLFHITPFGQYETHAHLNNVRTQEEILPKGTSEAIWLVPDYCHGGECYIGLENATANQTVSLLFQVLEGSENPLSDRFTGKQRITWSVLCNNAWKSLDDAIEENQIDNFLKSGIVSVSLPPQTTQQNTLLPSGYVWLKAKLHKQYDAVCKMIDIQAQAVSATFVNHNNTLEHLEHGLPPETISKLVTRVPQIKSVTQPFSSFGGAPLESDSAYYQRVSERLRHKNRAITTWDYEHITLQEFPEIYKALALKHTKEQQFLSPGNVTLVVIPDIVNKNVFDIYQPRVSKATLNRIQEHLSALTSMHINLTVVNPTYEEVTAHLHVQFHKGYDAQHFTKVLNQDLTAFLSPWAFDTTRNIIFGSALHTSVLIDYLEDLPYLDYVTEVMFSKKDGKQVKSVAPSSPAAILVSAQEHDIKAVAPKCNTTILEEAETCKY